MLLISGLVRVDTLVGLLGVIRINWELKVRLLALLVSRVYEPFEAVLWSLQEQVN